jgi:hypothetical protein
MENEKVVEAYLKYVGQNNRRPTSVYEFVSESGIDEDEFRKNYDTQNYCEKLEQSVWLMFFEKSFQKASAEEAFDGYSGREKLLSYYFTLVEILKQNSDFAKFTIEKPRPDWKNKALSPNFLFLAKPYFNNFVEQILQQSYDTGEALQRAFLSDYYKNILQIQLVTILFFWKKDNSFQAENTDAFIEKSVNFAFDVFGTTPFDSGFEWLKFGFQNLWKK